MIRLPVDRLSPENARSDARAVRASPPAHPGLLLLRFFVQIGEGAALWALLDLALRALASSPFPDAPSRRLMLFSAFGLVGALIWLLDARARRRAEGGGD